jgi:sodium/potassium-transporting ATPase subunit alpha
MDNEKREIDEQQQYPRTTANPIIEQKVNVDLWATLNTSRRDQDVHMIPLDSLFERFHTNQRTGLSTGFVHEARAQYGNNRITSTRSPNYFWLLVRRLFTGFALLLWIAGVLAFVGYGQFNTSSSSITNLGLGVVLFLVIISNAFLNFYQEMISLRIVASLSVLLPTIVTVQRDNIEQQIVADELVPGDIILIKMGNKLPADCRFLVCDGLKVNMVFFLVNSFVFIFVLKIYLD